MEPACKVTATKVLLKKSVSMGIKGQGDMARYCGSLLLMIMVLGVTFQGLSQNRRYQEPYKSENRPYLSPTPGEIPIMACWLCDYGVVPTSLEVKNFEDCGFNVLIQNSSQKAFDKIFPLLDGSNVKLIMSAEELRDTTNDGKCVAFMKKYKGQPRLAGWEFRDEPPFSGLPRYSRHFEEMTEADPYHLIHLNLVGEMNPGYVGPHTPTISAYLDTIQRKFAPGVWSYDYYPVMQNVGGPVRVALKEFYTNLESFSAMAKKTGRPFWAYCQSIGFRSGKIIKPTPREEFLRFEAFSALAYGAQGIVYWTYWQRTDPKGMDFEHLLSPVDRNMKKTYVWNYARNVNVEIKRYGHVFLDSKLIDVGHTGVSNYGTAKIIQGEFGPLSEVKSGDKGVLVSHLRTGSMDYLVFVNHDVLKKQKVKIRLKNNIELTKEDSGKRFGLGGDYKSFTLAPGGYAIFRIKALK